MSSLRPLGQDSWRPSSASVELTRLSGEVRVGFMSMPSMSEGLAFFVKTFFILPELAMLSRCQAAMASMVGMRSVVGNGLGLV